MSFFEAMRFLGLEPREQQIQMHEHLDDALTNRKVVFIQAGTGTGKSYVLLSEAAAWSKQTGLPTLVVCPNNTLINQYVHKDAPRIAEALGVRIEYIKGRGRYVCANSNAFKQEFFGEGKESRAEAFHRLTDNGMVLEWVDLRRSEEYGCPGSRRCKPGSMCMCGAFDREEPTQCICPPTCGIQVARRKAASANVVITNAHVLVWDERIRWWTDGAFGLLPEYGALFVDECHELEGVGRDVMSVEIGDKSRLWDMSRDIRDWRKTMLDQMVAEGTQELVLDLNDPEHDALREHACVLASRYSSESEERERVEMLVDFLTEADSRIAVVQLQPGSDPDGPPRFVCAGRCIDAGGFFNTLLTAQPTVMTSGTIPPSDKRRLGVAKAKLQLVGHPFDYSKSRMWIAPYDARDRDDLLPRIQAVVRAIEAVDARGGGTLMLFTSWADLDFVTGAVGSLLDGVEIWVQGREEEYQATQTTLADDVDAFRAHGRGVLAGVASLFTGLDIPGPALSQVVIWKLPYAVPDAEVRAIQDRYGQSVYRDQMMMRLVQGIGRLVRTTEDTGNVLIMDQRAARLDFESNSMATHLLEFGTM